MLISLTKRFDKDSGEKYNKTECNLLRKLYRYTWSVFPGRTGNEGI